MTAVATARTSSRLADWRFLLPYTGTRAAHVLLLGGTPEMAPMLRDLGVAARISTSLDACPSADAVVVLAGAPVSLATAASRVAPGGVFYGEVDRRIRRAVGLTPRRAAACLRAAGLSPAAQYWVKPAFPVRGMYLPLGSAAAMRWYLDTLYRPSTGARRLLRAGLAAVARRPAALEAIAPCFAITARRGEPHAPALVHAACTHLGWRADAVEPLWLAHARSEWSRLAVLLFERGAARPALAVKLARRPAFNAQVEWEHVCLSAIARALDASLSSALPSSTLFEWNGLSVVAQTCVRGAALTTRIGADRDRRLDDLRLVNDWLARFARATVAGHVPARQWLSHRFDSQLIPAYKAAFGVTGEEAHLFAAARAAIDRTAALQLPLTWQHHDFGPWNIYRDGDRLSVIDWETARRGPALTDLIYFVTHWTTALGGDGVGLPHIDGLFCGAPADRLAAAARAAVTAFADRLRIDRALLPLLLLYTLIEQAIDRAGRLAAAGDSAPGDRGSNPYVGGLAGIARHWERLFDLEVRRAA